MKLAVCCTPAPSVVQSSSQGVTSKPSWETTLWCQIKVPTCMYKATPSAVCKVSMHQGQHASNSNQHASNSVCSAQNPTQNHCRCTCKTQNMLKNTLHVQIFNSSNHSRILKSPLEYLHFSVFISILYNSLYFEHTLLTETNLKEILVWASNAFMSSLCTCHIDLFDIP